MRGTIILLTILLVTPAFAFSQTSATQNRPDHNVQQQGQSAITGCLTGKPDQYQLVDHRGVRHLLMNPMVRLHPYVGKLVTLEGKSDEARDASASSDEGTPFGMHFFRVDKVSQVSDQCQ